jgi:hypothetical protein
MVVHGLQTKVDLWPTLAEDRELEEPVANASSNPEANGVTENGSHDCDGGDR